MAAAAKRPVFQFTPLREGRRAIWDGLTNVDWISIHAPPRGATSATRSIWANLPISIHAPPRGATCTAHRAKSPASFQFTPLREGRPGKTYGALKYVIDFNSRPSARGDDFCRPILRNQLHFNSRPSARGDGKRYAISANLLFNPYKSAWLNNRATQFVEIILVIFHRIIA